MEKIIAEGKALYREDERLYIAKGYMIYKSDEKGKLWEIDGKIQDRKYALLSRFSRLLNRLLRIEVSNMVILDDGTRVLSAKKGIFVAKPSSKRYLKTFHISRGNKPMNIALDGEGNLYFGEYFLNGRFGDKEREEVHIYRSEDNGESWQICYTFPKNTIRHIHGIFYDSYADCLWVTTGDRDDESMIASTADGFKTVEILKRGSQRYRAVTLLFYKDHIVYGTDTEHEMNHIYSIDRKSGKERRLVALPGSVMMAVQSGERAVLSTAVEPSKVNSDPYATIWYSKDGLGWNEIYKVCKDRYSMRYFQYGRITFPYGAVTANDFIFSGHALENIDNKVLLKRVDSQS